jgi:hypothetical protein
MFVNELHLFPKGFKHIQRLTGTEKYANHNKEVFKG